MAHSAGPGHSPGQRIPGTPNPSKGLALRACTSCPGWADPPPHFQEPGWSGAPRAGVGAWHSSVALASAPEIAVGFSSPSDRQGWTSEGLSVEQAVRTGTDWPAPCPLTLTGKVSIWDSDERDRASSATSPLGKGRKGVSAVLGFPLPPTWHLLGDGEFLEFLLCSGESSNFDLLSPEQSGKLGLPPTRLAWALICT